MGNQFGTQAVERAIDVLFCFSQGKPEWRITELSKKLGLPTSTIHRIVDALTRRNFLDSDPDTHEYRLGIKLLELSEKVQLLFLLRKIIRPFLKEIANEFKEAVHVATLYKGECMWIDKIEDQRSLRVVMPTERKLPFHCSALGKTLLASLGDQEVEGILKSVELVPLTPNTLTDLDSIKASLRKVRDKGFAVDNEEYELGLRCVGVPIRNQLGKVVASISVSGPVFRMKKKRIIKIANFLKEVSQSISSQLPIKGLS